jgi:ergothioneine biosynthesis protein EgtB
MSCVPADGQAARQGDARWLARALVASRADTLATFGLYERGLDGLRVPARATLNPPLWELGHIGWFQEYWLARNPQRSAGAAADPDVARSSALRPQADALYNSSLVPHATRWSLPLPDVAGTRADLARQLDRSLTLLQDAGGDDDALYFFRLALLHEDMHHEAALYMAQSLGLMITDPRWQASPLDTLDILDTRDTVDGHCTRLEWDAGKWSLGSTAEGFAFDNELGQHQVEMPATSIDARVLRWADYLPFVAAGGYQQESWWSEAGRAWLVAGKQVAPLYLRRAGADWQHWRHGRWQALDQSLAACHLTAHEAQAWCRWAGRRLPTEAEWERAAVERPDDFAWGQVWEWTASTFVPFPGFVAHSYRDYSAPWFGTRPVLRGASYLTQPRLRHVRYRNFFMADRNDVPAGFRTCEV